MLQVFLDDESETLARLEATYKQALQDIDDKIAILMSREDAAGGNLQSVIYQRQHQQALRKQISGILDMLQAEEFETVSDYLAKSYEDGFVGAMYSLQQQGVPLAFPINQEEVAQAVQLDSKISEGLYSKVGENVADLKKKITAEVSRGISTASSYSQIARQIRRHMIGNYENKPGGALYRSQVIARTEGGRIQSQAAMNACYKARDIGADVVKKWSATLDDVTRESHWEVHGQIREIDEKFSNGLMFPHDPAGGAAEVCNCRCALLQKARWALEADETQYLGDVSSLRDERKQQLADKLHVPVDKLEEYSKQIVPINAKSYDDFKKKYNELWHYEGSDLQKQAEARIAEYKAKRNSAR